MKNGSTETLFPSKPSPHGLKLEYSIAVITADAKPVNFNGSAEIPLGLSPAHLIASHRSFATLLDLLVVQPTLTEVRTFLGKLLEEAHRPVAHTTAMAPNSTIVIPDLQGPIPSPRAGWPGAEPSAVDEEAHERKAA